MKEIYSGIKNFLEKHSGLIIPITLISAPLIIYFQAATYELVWTDTLAYFNSHPLLVSPSWEKFSEAWSSLYIGEYTPIMLTYWVLIKIAGDLFLSAGQTLNTIVLHLSSIILHIINGLLVFSILNKILKHKWFSLAGALIFLLHPIQVQAVVWISGSRELLSTCFGLASVDLYLKNRDNISSYGREYIVKNSLSILMFIFALLSKPSIISLPFFIAAIEFFIFNKSVKQTILASLPWFIVIILWSAVSLPFVIKTEFGVISYTTPIWTRPFILADEINFYLYKILYPISLDVSYARLPKDLLEKWWLYVLWIIPVALSIELWSEKKRLPLLITGFVIFIMGFLPMSGLITYSYHINWSTVADRYLYFSMLGVSLAFAWMFSFLKKPALKIVLVIILVFLGLQSFYIQIPVWENSYTLWTHCIEVTPEEARAYYNRGLYYIKKGDPINAVKDLNRTIEIDPKMHKAYMNRGVIFMSAGKYDIAMADFNRSINLDPKSIEAYYNRGNLFKSLGNPGRALKDYEEALKLEPLNINVLNNRGILLAGLKDYKNAMADYNRALEADPNEAEVYYNRGNLYRMMNIPGKAIEDYTRAAEINPLMWQAFFNRAGINILLKKNDEALKDINRVLQIDPKNVKAAMLREKLIGK